MAIKKFRWEIKPVYLVPSIVLLTFFIWFISVDYPSAVPLGIGFQERLDTGMMSFGLSDCDYKRTPYDCVSTMECDERCDGYELFGICIGKKVKTNCKAVEKCSYKTEWVCDDSSPYDINPNPDSGDNYEEDTKWCPSGTILSGNECIDPYSDYEQDTNDNQGGNEEPKHKSWTETDKKTRLICGGDVIQNSYIRGWRFIQEQEITTTCNHDCWDGDCSVDCSDKVTNVKVKDDCTQLCYGYGILEKCTPRAKVCQDKSGTPRCVTYPLELRVYTILDKIGNMFEKKA